MDEDQKAIIDCQMGKQNSYRYLVEKYKSRAYYAALLYTGNSEEALDLSQEAFCKAFRSIKKFKTGKNFYTWLYQILKNLCINHYNRKKKRSFVFSEVEKSAGNELYLSHESKPDEIFEEHELKDLLWKSIDKLKKDDREIIILKEFNEMSYKEISEILKIPVGSVMSRLYYARKKLGKFMEEMT